MSQLYTNAPSPWPQVEFDAPSASLDHPVGQIHFFAALQRLIKPLGGRVQKISQTILTEQGVLDIPCVAEVGGQSAAFLLYSTADQKSAQQYSAAKKVIQERLGLPAYYYAPAALDLSAEPVANPCRLLNSRDFSRAEEKPEGTYAIWLASPQEERYIGAVIQPAVLAAYEAVDGVETYVFADLSWALDFFEKVEGEKRPLRVQLPNEPLTAFVQGPQSIRFFLVASQEKGISFRFQEGAVPLEYQRNFWNAFATYAQNIKEAVKKNDLPLDDNVDHPLEWYRMVENIQRKLEGGDKPIGIGIIGFRATQKQEEKGGDGETATPVAQEQETPAPPERISAFHRIMAALSYAPIPFILVPVVAARRSSFVRFHIKQGFILLLLSIAPYILSRTLPQRTETGLLIILLNSVSLLFIFFGIFTAATARKRQLPVIGPLARWLPFWKEFE
jgi:uncharacterized membrane protein